MTPDAETALAELRALQQPRKRRPQPWTLEDLLARYVAGRLGTGW